MYGNLAGETIRGLCERAAELLLDVDARTVFCDLSGVTPDAAALDVVARLCLAALRQGQELRFIHVSPELEELLALSGFEIMLLGDTGCNPSRS